ncbi:MAG: c-type cytochrome [Sphingobium sp.]|nr:c-type cytochrome [Sphingobium sp.]
MGRLAALAVALLASQPAVAPPDSGRAIYEQGIGHDALSATMGDPPWPITPSARACAACHGAAGLGASEGGIAAPPLELSALSVAQAVERLATALRHGRGNDGRALLAAMPRYTISDGDLAALAIYVRSLPYPPQPGLTASNLAIALDLDGSGFTRGEQIRLRERFGSTLARTNNEGGLFGRELTLAATPGEAFFTISWAGLADHPSLAIVARPPGGAECAACCASLHADLDAQVEWLEHWLGARKAAVAYHGSLAAKFAQPGPPSHPTATVHVGPPGELGTPPAGPLYLFADLGRPAKSLGDRPDTYLVSAFDLEARLSAVDALAAADRSFADAPRLASAAVELGGALAHMLDALTAGGRRVLRYEVCRRLRETVPVRYAFTVFDMARGVVIARSSGLEPAM